MLRFVMDMLTRERAVLRGWIRLCCVLASAGCSGVAAPDDAHSPVVIAYGRHEQALTADLLRSMNGTYGPGCVNRADESWSVLVDPGVDVDHAPLSVVQGNDGCELTLTELRAGADDGEIYLADPPILLSSAFQGSTSAFLPGGVGQASFYGNARLSALTFDAPFQLIVVYSDDAQLGSTDHQALLVYDALVMSDSPVSFWRLGDAATTVAADEQGVNDATYVNGVVLGAQGAIVGDDDTAAVFDGVNDYVLMARQIQDDFSIEFWFKSTQGIGTSSQWYGGAGLVDAEVGGVTNDFGVTLRSDGRVMAGTGNPDRTIISAAGFDDDAWHHVVFTRTRSNGALRLYVDGALETSGTGGTQALNPANIRLGSLQTNINFYAGALDEVAVYAAVLSAATILEHYHSATVSN